MTRPLVPFDFDDGDEDDEDAATVLMSGHQRHLLREALRTPAPLDALVLEGGEVSESEVEPAVAVALEEEPPRPARWAVVTSMVLLAVAVGLVAYIVLVVRPAALGSVL